MSTITEVKMDPHSSSSGSSSPPSSSSSSSSSSKSKQEKLRGYQRVIFVSLFLGYMCYNYNRKSVSYVTPTLLSQGLITTNSLGLIISCQNLAYAISKFMGGVLSDRISARILFVSGLLMSGGSTLLFPYTENAGVWALLWFCNGFAQGAGWPACAKLLKKWYSPARFGTLWSMLTSSTNVSGMLSPILSVYIIINYNWTVSLVLAGLVSILIGLMSMTQLIDDPSKVNLPDPRISISTLSNGATNEKTHVNEKPKTDENSQMTIKDLVTSPILWVVSFCYMIVFGTRTAMSDWVQIYQMEQLGRTQLQASSFTSFMEMGGLFGRILAGVVTDKLVSRVRMRGNVRLVVGSMFICICVISIHILRTTLTYNTSQFVSSTLAMVLGASMFGPMTIFGIVATESFPQHISGTSCAIATLSANVGAIAAGWPISWVSRIWSWDGVFVVLQCLCATAALTILSTRSLHNIKRKIE